MFIMYLTAVLPCVVDMGLNFFQLNVRSVEVQNFCVVVVDPCDRMK